MIVEKKLSIVDCRLPVKKNQGIAFLLSVCIHLLLIWFFFFGAISFIKHAAVTSKEIPPPPEVIFDLSSPAPTPPPSTIRTAAEHPLEKAPDHAPFESHENTEASSELSANGSVPLPTQEGRESESIELKTSETIGRTTPDSSSTAEAPSTVVPPSPPTLPAATSTTALSEKNPSVHPVMGTLSAAAKSQSEASGAHPSMIHGAISNKGKSSITAEATPLGRYKKNLADAISSHWYYAIDQRMELLSFGTATVIFHITQNGKVEKLRIISNSSNQTFADCCVESITGAKLPSIPPEIAQTLDHGRLEIEYRFTIYP